MTTGAVRLAAAALVVFLANSASAHEPVGRPWAVVSVPVDVSGAVLPDGGAWQIDGLRDIRGRVVDDQSDRPIRPASVKILELNRSALTDGRGAFSFGFLPARTYTLRVVAIGYRGLTVVTPSDDDPLTIRLEPEAALSGDEVVVTARVEKRGDEVPVQQAAKEMATTLYPDLSTVLQTLPGVAGAGHFDARLFVQGGGSDEIAAWLDRTYVQNPYKWGGRLSIFNLDTLEKAELFKAGYPALYGGALSGILDVTTRAGSDEKTEGTIDLSAGGLTLLGSGPVPGGKGTWLAAANRTWTDVLVNVFFPQQNVVSPSYSTAQFKWTGWAGENDTVTANLLYRDERLKMNFPESSVSDPDRRFEADVVNTTVSLDWQRFFGAEVLSRTTVSFIHVDESYLDRAKFDEITADVKDDQGQVRTDWTVAGPADHTIKAGAVGFLTGYGGTLRGRLPRLVPPAAPSGTASVAFDRFDAPLRGTSQVVGWVYVQDEWGIMPGKLELDAGAVAGHSGVSGESSFDPRVSLIARPDPITRIRLAAGRYHQYPIDPSQAQSSGSAPDLSPSRSTHLSADFERDFIERYKVRVGGYRKLSAGLPAGSDALGFRNEGAGRAWGFDLFLQATQRLDRRWSGWIAYSVGRAERSGLVAKGPRRYAATQPTPDPAWRPADHDQRHGFTAVANVLLSPMALSLKPKWALSILWKFHDGWPYTPPDPSVAPATAVDPQSGETVVFPVLGVPNSARYPDWHELSIRLNYIKPLAGGRRFLAAYVQAMNVYNRHNVQSYIWTADLTDRLSLYDVPPSFFLLAGLRLEW